MSFVQSLKQDVTHWPVTGTDGYGGFTFGTPVLLKGRWEEKQELFINQDAEEALSQVICYLNTDITPGDFVALGDLTAELDPTATTGFRVRNYGKVTDLSALQSLRKLWL